VEDQLVEICRELLGCSVDPDFVRAVLLTDGSFQCLPGNADWWWRPIAASRGRNRLVNTIVKVMAACRSIQLGELREASRRHVRSNHIALPTRALRAICASLPFLAVRDNVIEALPDKFNWDSALNQSDQLLLEIFNRGVVLDSYTVSEEGLALGINENSLSIYKTYSPLLWKPVAGHYSVVGSDIPTGLIDELERKKERPGRPTLGFGWTADHKLLFARNITDGVWLSGIVNLPAAVQEFVVGEYRLFGLGKHELGDIHMRDGSVFGIKPFLRMFGGDPGDVLVLLFDLKEKRCESWLGGRELSEIIKLGPDATSEYLSGASTPEAPR
jgi:hypothetical protein